MRKSKFSEEQIIAILAEQERGMAGLHWPAPSKWPSFKVRARRVMCGGHTGTPST
jgi:hypothetical protein